MKWQCVLSKTIPKTEISALLDSWFNPLNTKLRLLYLKTKFVPRSKHFYVGYKTNQFML